MPRARKYELPHGEGSFYQRASDGRWVGTIEAGWSSRGTRRRITVTDRDKQRAWDKFQARRKEVKLEGLTPEGVRAGASVESWMREWLEGRRCTVRPKTSALEESMSRTWIVPVLGRRKLAGLGPQDMRALTTAITSAGRSTTTAQTAQRILQQALRAAVVEGHQVPQRAIIAPAPRRAAPTRAAIPEADAIRLLDHAAGTPDAARWVAALLQGMRQGEVLGLTWECVDLEAGTVDVSWQLQALRYLDRASGTFVMPDGYEARRVWGALHLVRPKTRSGYRVIPLVPWMRAALADLAAAPRSPTGLVWYDLARPERPRTSEADRAAWRRLQAEAGVARADGRPYVLHEARHTTATLLLGAGVDPEVIKAIMGHSDIVTTHGYQHVSTDMSRAALERVAERLRLGPG